MSKFKIEKGAWLECTMIIIGELILVFFIFRLYPLISMLFLGEGSDSLLYSTGNTIVWALLPFLLPTFFNFMFINEASLKHNFAKVNMFKFIEIVLVVFYLPFLIWRYYTLGFHI